MANTLTQNSLECPPQAAEPSAILHSLFEYGRRAPTDIAFRDLGNGDAEVETISFAELAAKAALFGEQLCQATGSLPGEVRAAPSAVLQFSPGIDYIAALFGCWWAGVTAVPAYLPRSSRHSERLAAILKDCDPTFVLTTPEHVDRIHNICSAAAPNADVIELCAAGARLSLTHPPHPELKFPVGPALIQYTSGSTGSPKGVMVTHANLLHNVEASLAGLPSPPKVSVSWLPPYHDMGLISKILLPVHAGIEAVLLSPFGFMQRPFRWLKAISDYQGSFSGAPDSAYDLCCRRITDAEKCQLDLSSWEVAFNGSEPIRHNTLLKFSETFRTCGFNPKAARPVYGLAEATLCVTQPTAQDIPTVVKRKTDGRVFVSCGKPLTGMDVRIVEQSEESKPGARTVAGGEEGEIWISGPSVADGYFGQDEATDRIFKGRITPDNGQTYLRTGDVGFLSKGELFVSGRLKNILIFNGQNFHPEDIERAVEQCHPSLHTGGTAAFACESAFGREQLALALEVPHRETQDYESIVKVARETVGSQFDLRAAVVVCVKDWRLPRTTSGKIQRTACAAQLEDGWPGALHINDQRSSSSNGNNRRAAAAHEILETVCATMEDVFGIPTIAPDTDFFELGGHSLTATRVASRLSAALNRSIPIRLVFEAPTPNELAVAIARECKEVEPAAPASPADISFLTSSQRRMWFLHVADPESSAYNVGGALGVDGDFDAETAVTAFRMCLEAHPILRATYGTKNGLPIQRISPPESIDLSGVIRDFRKLQDARSRVNEQTTRLTEQPFDLENGPLCKFRIFQLANDSHVLAVSLHHIVIDGWAIGILIRDLFQNYAALREGRVAEVTVTNSTTRLLAPSEKKIQGQLDYWNQTLAGAPDSLDLPVDYTPPRLDAADGALCKIPISPELTAEMQRVARNHRSSLFIVMLAGFQVLLSRYSNQRDFLIGVPVANRNYKETEDVVASMVNTLPYRANMSDNPTLSELLARARNNVLDMQDNQDAPLEHILDLMTRKTGASGNSPFRVMFDYQEFSLPQNGSFKFNTEAWETHRGAAQFDLSLFVSDINGDYFAAFEYRPALFGAETIQRMGEHFVNILWHLVESGNRSQNETVLNTPLLSKRERQEILQAHNETAFTLNAGENLLHDFARRADENPTAIAVSCGDAQITFAELDATSNRIARLLHAEGIGRGDNVAVYLERSAEMLTTLLGILKSGACYIPLDPEYPAARIAMILEDAAPRAAVTQTSLAANISNSQTFLIDDAVLRTKLHALSDAPVDLKISPDDIAYIIFTSGSTGRPKGVAIPHRGLHNFLHSMANEPGLSKGDVLLAVTTVSFDISGLEMFLPLICGAHVHIARRDEALDGHHLISVIETLDVSHLQATPATWQLLLTCGWEGKQHGRPLKMLCGGEELPQELASKLVQCGGELWNLYGPTETTIWSTVRQITSADSISIGKPIANTQCYILDDHFEPVPMGVSGELFIGGYGVAAGYHNRPDLTADRFVTDPFAGNGARMYRTGDLARYDSSGELQYLGRLDHQVKVRGHRIELGEIATALDSHPSVHRSVVTATELPGLGKSLVAYCESKEPDINTKLLLDHVRMTLPAYMVPAAVVIMEALPQTPNGKIDRKRLPLPTASASSDCVAPKNELERRMTEIWADLLNLPKVGITDDFFALGGHSLLAAQAFIRMKEELGVDLPLNTLFEQATVLALAERWEQGRIEQEEDLPKGVAKLHEPVSDTPHHPTTLLWVHPLGGGGGGGLLSYRKMARNLPTVRSFGIRETGEKFETLDEMSQRYAEHLDEAIPQGPVSLAGFCFGGNLALEVARKMTAMGRTVQEVFLLDARPAVAAKADRRKILGAINRVLTGSQEERQRLITRAARNVQHRLNTLIVGGESAEYVPDLEEVLDLNEYPESYREVARHHWLLLQRHALTAYSGAVMLLRSTSEHSPNDDTTCGWKSFIPQVSVETIAGRHEAFLRSTEMMSQVSEVIGERLNRDNPE